PVWRKVASPETPEPSDSTSSTMIQSSWLSPSDGPVVGTEVDSGSSRYCSPVEDSTGSEETTWVGVVRSVGTALTSLTSSGSSTGESAAPGKIAFALPEDCETAGERSMKSFPRAEI